MAFWNVRAVSSVVEHLLHTQGVAGSNPAPRTISPEEISRLQQTQLDLLKLAATKLKPGGVLIYSTCSLEPEENSEVVKEFLRKHKNFKLESERELLPFCGQHRRRASCKVDTTLNCCINNMS